MAEELEAPELYSRLLRQGRVSRVGRNKDESPLAGALDASRTLLGSVAAQVPAGIEGLLGVTGFGPKEESRRERERITTGKSRPQINLGAGVDAVRGAQARYAIAPETQTGERYVGNVQEAVERAGSNFAKTELTPKNPFTGRAYTFEDMTTDAPGAAAIMLAGANVLKLPKGKGVTAALRKGKEVEPPLLGRFETTTPGRIVNATAERGGYSVNLPSGEIPTEGLMMGKYGNDDPRNLVADALTRSKLKQHVEKNTGGLNREDVYLGTWRDPDTGKVYVDTSKRFPSDERRQATKYGERTGQIAGWDVGKAEQFPVGSSEKFIQGPEFNRRMHELNAEGAQYLASKGGPEDWWKGSTFERVYGEGDKPQVAGFTASTAPNNLLRNNVQQMTEYMRRHKKGEPIVQPDWRAGDDLMTWQPGSKIGMEEGRSANLRKSAAGQLDQLQANKVREEAAAMMGDPNAAPLDRYWARVAEDPERGVFTASGEGKVDPGKPYEMLKREVWTAAEEAGMPLAEFSGNVWTAVRERIRQHGELYGQKFRKGAAGESKSYDEHFKDLISEKAQHLGITVPEMEKRLAAGDGNLLAWIAATPLLAPVIADVLGGQTAETGAMQ